MSVYSAGILLYRLKDNAVEVLLAHPGGPFWSGKDLGAWTIPKGLTEADEDFLQAALKEKAAIVGLSALMTTTMVEMEAVINIIKNMPSLKSIKISFNSK